MTTHDYFSSERLDMLPFVPAAASYLDIGCGEGRFGEHLRSRGAEVWGIEPSERWSEADRRLDRAIHGTFPECSSEIDRLFDCIICNDVLEHMYDPWAACSSLAELLKPSGVLVTSIPNFRNFATLMQIGLRGRWDYVPAGVLDRTHLRFFTLSTMKEMIEASGFQVESVTGSWPLSTPKMRAVRAAARVFTPSLGREGAFRQFVIVARKA